MAYLAVRFVHHGKKMMTEFDNDGKTVQFTYTNWKGKTATRTVRPIELKFGSTIWHKKPQYLLSAYDLDRKENRCFALSDISNWKQIDLREAKITIVINKHLPSFEALHYHMLTDISKILVPIKEIKVNNSTYEVLTHDWKSLNIMNYCGIPITLI